MEFIFADEGTKIWVLRNLFLKNAEIREKKNYKLNLFLLIYF